MENFKIVLLNLLIPFLGTTLGAGTVFFMKKEMTSKLKKALSGFAAGVMIAASVWSLLLPSLDISKNQWKIEWLPATIGFMIGIIFLLILDSIIPHLHYKSNKPEGIKAKIKEEIMLVLAVTLHNIPEGMTIGVILASILIGQNGITEAGALALAIGLAIQNFPEGAIISAPLKSKGVSKGKSFFYGMLSGIVEPIAAIITILLTSIVTQFLPYLLSFAAGAMVYVVIEELIPESQEGEHSNIGTIGFSIGFILMMILDITLG